MTGSANGATGSVRKLASATGRARVIGWVAIIVTAVAFLVVAGTEQGGVETDGERVQRLSDSFACPVCSGESVAESNAAVAATIRQFIADEVTDGSTDKEIRDELIGAYGAEVLLNPPAEGIATLIWVLPVVAIAGGAVIVAAAVTRSVPDGRDPSDDDLALLTKARDRATDGPVRGRATPDGGEGASGRS